MIYVIFILIFTANGFSKPNLDYKQKESYVSVKGRMNFFNGGSWVVSVENKTGDVFVFDSNKVQIKKSTIHFDEINSDYWPKFLKQIKNLKLLPADKSFHRCLCHCPQYEFDLHYIPNEYLKTVRFEKCGDQIILNIKENDQYQEIELKDDMKTEFLEYFKRIKEKLSKDVLTR